MSGAKSDSVGKSRAFAEIGFVVMWSSGFIGARLGTSEASTPTLMAWRFLIAATLLATVAFVLRRGRVSFGEAALQGVVGFLAQGVYLTGIVGAVEFGVSAGSASLVAALQPLLAAALSGPILGERVRLWQWVGLVVGLAGVALVVGGDASVGGGAPMWAYAMPFVGMAGLVAATLTERKASLRASRDTPLDAALAIQCAVSAVVFAGLAFFWGGIEPGGGVRFWAAVGWFVVFSTFGGYGFYWLNVKLSGVTRVSSLIYLTPPTTMVWASVMFGEEISRLALMGLAICAFGVFLANKDGRSNVRQ